MLVSLLIMAIAQAKPQPLDAFRTNFAAIKAEVDFEYSDGRLGGKASDVWAARRPPFLENGASKILGHWACDGEVEYYQFRSSAEMLELAEKNRPRVEANKLIMPVHYVPFTEALWDGHLMASHTRDPIRDPAGHFLSWSAVHVGPVHEEPGCLTDGRGPFYWGFSYTFPQIVQAMFPGVDPTVRKSIRGGHAVDVEVYQQDDPGGGWVRFEVSYDPAVGCLPRYARIVSLSPTDVLFGKEMYLVTAKPCATGGFVPTEWFCAYVHAERFSTRFPHYNDDTILKTEKPSAVGRFIASGFRNRTGPVALTELKDVTTLNTPGGWLRLKQTGPLTLAAIKRIAGKNLTNRP